MSNKKIVISAVVVIVLIISGATGFIFANQNSSKASIEQTAQASYSDEAIVKTDSSKYNYDKMEADLIALSDKYSNIMTYESIGVTADNRKIYHAIIGNKNADKHLVILASMHAREYVNSLLVMHQIETICENYSSASYNGEGYNDIFDKVCLHVVPMVNPDGVEISINGPDGIKDDDLRKNIISMCDKYGDSKDSYYTRWKANAKGVDLNRNYDINWDKRTSDIPTNPCANEYRGTKPYSEIETNAVMNLVNRYNPNAVISYHTSGSVVYWNCNLEKELQEKDKSLFELASELTGYPDAEPNLPADTPNGPTLASWLGEVKGIPTITIENGKGTAPVSDDEIASILEKNKDAIPAFALWVINN